MSCPVMTPKIMKDKRYHSTVIRSLDEFKAFGPQWAELLTMAGVKNINLEHDWLVTWLKQFPGQDIFVVLVKNTQDQVVAAAPFKLAKSPSGLMRRLLRRVQFIGTDPSVYDAMHVVIQTGEDTASVLQEVSRQLMAHQDLWDIIDLRYSPDSDQLGYLRQFLLDDTAHQELIPSMSIPTMILPQTVQAYEDATRKKGYKKDLKRICNHLNRDFPEQELHLEFPAPSPETAALMDQFFTLNIAHWKERGIRSEMVRFPQLSGFYKALHQQCHRPDEKYGRVQFSILKIGDTPLSYHLDFWQGDGCLGHMVAYDSQFKKYRPGVLHIEAMITHAIERGGEHFAFGRGEQPYKSQWTTSKTQLYNLLVFKTPWSRFLWQGDETLKRILSR